MKIQTMKQKVDNDLVDLQERIDYLKKVEAGDEPYYYRVVERGQKYYYLDSFPDFEWGEVPVDYFTGYKESFNPEKSEFDRSNWMFDNVFASEEDLIEAWEGRRILTKIREASYYYMTQQGVKISDAVIICYNLVRRAIEIMPAKNYCANGSPFFPNKEIAQKVLDDILEEHQPKFLINALAGVNKYYY